MAKTEVYSWRVSADLKDKLEDAAREQEISFAELLDRIGKAWLEDYRAAGREDEAEEQRRLHEAAAPFIGAIRIGGDGDRAENVRELVRERLRQQHRRHAG